MKSVTLNDQVIPLKIIKKNNKHTYFYFNEPGIIKVHLSKRHNMKFISEFLKDNEQKMYQKYINNLSKTTYDNNVIYKFGEVYELVKELDAFLEIDSTDNRIIIPKNNTDQVNKDILEIQKKWMKNYITTLENKYLNNPFIDIKNVEYRFSFMKSRYGSCNAKKRKIHLNLHLLKLDKSYTEYIFLHEISHLNIQNHSSDFYKLLAKLCPNYKEIRKSLRNKKLW